MTDHASGTSGVRWRVLALVVIASFVAYLLRTNMSIAGERMIADVGLTKVQLGAILASFAWGYAILQFPGGIWGGRLGGRKALMLMAIGWGVLNLAVGLIPRAPVVAPGVVMGALIVLRFLMGVAQAPLNPVIAGSTIARWFPVTVWGVPNGWVNVGSTFGAAAAGPLISMLIAQAGWRWSFLATAPLGLIMAALWWWYVRDTPADHAAVRHGELALIDRDRPSAAARAEPGDWRRVLLQRDVLLLTAGYFCSNYLFYFFFNWLFIYLVESRGFRILESGWYAAAPWIVGAIGAAIGAYLCDGLSARLGKRRGMRYTGMLGLVLAAVLILLAAYARHPAACVVFLSLCLGCQQLTEGAFWAATTSVAQDDAAAACGVLNTGGNVVGGIGALTIPLIVESLGWPVALATTSLFALAGAGLWLLIDAEATGPARHTADDGRDRTTPR